MEYKLKKGNIELAVLGKGAELVSLKKDGVEFIWERNAEFWGKSSPILFPFVGSLKDNKYKFDGKEYTIEKDMDLEETVNLNWQKKGKIS